MKESMPCLMPREIWEMQKNNERIHDILCAIWECTKRDTPIPKKWVDELLERIKVEKDDERKD